MISTARSTSPGEAPVLPADPAALLAHGAGALRDGRLAEAEAALHAAIARAPGLAAAHDNLGLALAALGRPAEAEAAHRQAIALAPTAAGAYNNLAVLLRRQGQCGDACAAIQQAIALDPSVAAFHLNHGETLRALKRPQEAAAAYASALRAKPDYADAYFALGQLWFETDNLAGARFALGACLKLDPGDRHGARALLAMIDPATPPPAQFSAGYVRNLFDGYAPRFEQHLLETLQYRGHTLLREAVDALGREGAARTDVLDLGCGTGLAGAAFRSIARRLVGVDLSPAMIEHARARQIYDELVVGDIDTALAGATGAYGIVVAADVFNYVGALDGVIPAMYRALEPGGIAAFTIESDPGGPPYRLLPSRRFAQNPDHVDALARACGFDVAARHDVVKRIEAGAPIAAALFALRRPS
ncbi:MAG: tetratricopeptide repeat protein [Alphaproteobacteria bacterium]|nr:tetratricopeptide repeat protein [Alphaproteobacteria bacterium]